MAAFDIDFPDDFLSELLDTDFDEIAEEALKETAPLLEKSLKKEARRAVMHEGESEMIDSIKPTKPKKAKTDAWIVNVGPRGYSDTKKYRGKNKERKYKVSNALKAIWKEYGIPGQQAPSPFIQSAVNAVKSEIENGLQEAYNRKVRAK